MFMVFLLESFDDSNVNIVSPWITSFDFTKELIYPPNVSSRNSIEILEGLLKHGIYPKELIVEQLIREYFVEEAQRSLNKIRTWKKLINLNINTALIK